MTTTFRHQGQSWSIYKRKRDADKPSAPWYFKIDNQPRSLQSHDRAEAIAAAKLRLDVRLEGRNKYKAFLDATTARHTLTLGDLAADWSAAGYPAPNGKPRPTTAAANQADTLTRALRWWAEHIPTTITAGTFHAFAMWRRAHATKGDGNRSIDIELTTLSNLCRWAIAAGRIEANPFAQRIRYQDSSDIQHCHQYAPAGDDELHTLTRWLLQGDPTQRIAGAQFLFQALTGLRPGEPSHLRRHATPQAGRPTPGQIFTRTVEGTPTTYISVHREKNGMNPAVKVHPALAVFLDWYLPWRDHQYPDNPYWFPHPRRADASLATTRGNKTLSVALHQATTALGLPERHAHGARAYYVRVRRSQGLDDATIAIELGQRGGARLVESVYGDPRDIVGDGRCNWIPSTGRPAWETLEQPAQNILPFTAAA